MCKRGCAEFRPVQPVLPKLSQVQAGSGDFDAKQAMRDLAEQLRQASAANPLDAVLAREYRLTLIELARGEDGDSKDPFAELLAELAGPVPAEVGDPAH